MAAAFKNPRTNRLPGKLSSGIGDKTEAEAGRMATSNGRLKAALFYSCSGLSTSSRKLSYIRLKPLDSRSSPSIALFHPSGLRYPANLSKKLKGRPGRTDAVAGRCL